MGFIPYMMIDFNPSGVVKVVVIDYEGVARNYAELYGFESKARSFNNKVKFILDEGDEEIQDADEIVLSEGRISNNQLCLYITIIEKNNDNNNEELDFPLCFTKSKDLIKFRQAAYSLLDK